MRRVMVVAVTVHATTAFAAEYGGETQGVTADELAALAAAGELDAAALEALLSLHDDPPDPAGAAPEELGLLPGVGRAEARQRVETRGPNGASRVALVRVDTGGTVHQRVPPQGFARLRLTPSPHVAASVLALVRERTRLDARGAKLVSDGPRREVGLERWYVMATLGDWRLVAGNYNCNFAESLTFSSSRRLYAPTLETADALVRASDARTLSTARALRGLAAQLELGTIELTAFASYRSVDLYQYGEWQRDGASPQVVVRGSGEALRYATFADAARETVGGANLDIRFGPHVIGATAYVGAARLTDTAGQWSLSSVYPVASRFGAVGVHALGQAGPVRARAEGARVPSGGLGAVARIDVAFAQDCDVGLAGRYYQVGFDNPFTRSVAAPDELEGARARNERGVELSTSLALGTLLRFAVSIDAWTSLTAPNIVNGRARGRSTWQLTTREALVLEGDCIDKDLRYAGVYAGPQCDATGADCARGARASGTARLVSERLWRTRIGIGVRHSREDAVAGVATESRATAHVTVRPVEALTVSVLASERLSARAPQIDGGTRLVALAVVGRIGESLSLELMARADQRWDASRQSEPTTIAGALTLTVQR